MWFQPAAIYWRTWSRWRWWWRRRNGHVILSFVIVWAKSDFTTIPHIIILDNIVILESVNILDRDRPGICVRMKLSKLGFGVQVALQPSDARPRENAENLSLVFGEVSWSLAAEGLQIVAQERSDAGQAKVCQLGTGVQQADDALEDRN